MNEEFKVYFDNLYDLDTGTIVILKAQQLINKIKTDFNIEFNLKITNHPANQTIEYTIDKFHFKSTERDPSRFGKTLLIECRNLMRLNEVLGEYTVSNNVIKSGNFYLHSESLRCLAFDKVYFILKNYRTELEQLDSYLQLITICSNIGVVKHKGKAYAVCVNAIVNLTDGKLEDNKEIIDTINTKLKLSGCTPEWLKL